MPKSTGRLMERLRPLWSHFYEERQIYLRSHGQVQFVSLSPLAQLGLAVLATGFLSWVAFTSVNVVFKEQIIASKDRHFLRMQAAYEERISGMQLAYDNLNGQLVVAQEKFLAQTSELEHKHHQIIRLLEQKHAASRQLDAMRKRFASTVIKPKAGLNLNKVMMNATGSGTRLASRQNGIHTIMGGLPDSGFAADGSSLRLLPEPQKNQTENGEGTIESRLGALDQSQQSFINLMEEATDRQVHDIQSFISMTNAIDPLQFLERLNASPETAGGMGGPLFSIAGEETGIKKAPVFSRQIYRISQNLDKIASLNHALGKIPLGSPLYHNRITSPFGRRVDPFTRKLTFHSGVDMGAPYGSPVYATASGTVRYAGQRVAYGRMIEIDHGNGLRTRFGHLKSIHVKKGQRVSFRQKIGRVGSTGRSTGPHVHYEVWFDGAVRDPSNFIEAGKYVFTHKG